MFNIRSLLGVVLFDVQLNGVHVVVITTEGAISHAAADGAVASNTCGRERRLVAYCSSEILILVNMRL
jgi:hypothetical protein